MEQAELEGLTPEATLTVYPTALKARAVLRAAARRDGVVLGTRVTTFPELTDTLARELGVDGLVLPPELAAVVLETVLAGETQARPPGARGRGLVRELQAAIDELKAASVAPGDVTAVATALAPFEAAARVTELGRLYRGYEDRLARVGALDRHGREWRVAERLGEWAAAGRRPPCLAGVRRVVFAEIYDFSVLQYLIATALIRLVGDAELVLFAHPENVEATRFLDRTWNRFVGSESIADQVLPSFVVRGGRAGALAAALRGVFAEAPAEPGPSDGSIRLLVAPHRYGEVEAALREIRMRIEAGADPERLAVVVRDMGPYADLIDDVARRFRVPVVFRQSESLLGAGCVREAIGLLRAALEGAPRPRLAAILQSDYLRFRSPRAAALLARIGYVSQAACPLAACLERGGEDARPGADAHAPQLARDVARDGPRLLAAVRVLEGLAAPRTFTGHVRAWRGALRALGFRPVAREDDAPAAAARDARAWRRLGELLDAQAALVRRLGQGMLALDDFLGEVLGAAELEQAVERPATRGVAALSVLDARGLDFDVVYLLGLDDGTFPAARRENVVLPDAIKRTLGPPLAATVRARLGARGAELPATGLLRTAREASLEDPFLFFLALSMAERELVLAHPAADEAGNPTVRSPFVDEVEACLTAPLPVTEVDAVALVPARAQCREPGELVARAALDRWRGGAADALGPALRAALPDGERRLAELDRRAEIEAARARYFLTPLGRAARLADADRFVGRVAAAPALAQRLGAFVWSASSIERLAACGFKFFASGVLGLRELEQPSGEIDQRERGSLLHAALEIVLRECAPLPEDPAAARARARQAVAARRAEILARLPPKDAELVDVEWPRVLAVVGRVAEREAARQALARERGERLEHLLEWRFDVLLPAAERAAAVRVRGSVDRIDLWRRGPAVRALAVLDYKMRRERKELRALLEEPKPGAPRTAFQLPLYVEAALRGGLPGVTPETPVEAGLWLPLLAEDGGEELRPFDGGRRAAAAADLHALLDEARAGRFDVAPRVCDEWCAFRSVCRYQPPPIEDEHG